MSVKILSNLKGVTMHQIFSLSNKYIILATPLILYSLFSSVYMLISMNGHSRLNGIFAALLLLLMSAAFIAGWFYMIKEAVTDSDKEDPTALIKDFPAGVGEYFLPALGAIFITTIIFIVMIKICITVGTHILGDIDIYKTALLKSLNNANNLKIYLDSLMPEQLARINAWNLLLLAGATIPCFLLILYIPALFFKSKNPLIALWVSLKNLCSRHFFKTIGITVLILTINLIISVMSALSRSSDVLVFIITILNFYFVTVTSVGIFYYYYHTFVKQKIGQTIDIKI